MYGANTRKTSKSGPGCSVDVDESPTPKLSEPSIAVFQIATVTADRLYRASLIYEKRDVVRDVRAAKRCRELSIQLSECAAWVAACNEHGATDEQKRKEHEAMMKLVDESAPLLGMVGQWL